MRKLCAVVFVRPIGSLPSQVPRTTSFQQWVASLCFFTLILFSSRKNLEGSFPGQPYLTILGAPSKIAKHGRLVNIPKWSKGAQKGPKWSTWKFLTIWDPCGPCWTISNDSNDFLLKSTSAKSYFVLMGQQIEFVAK